MRMHALTQGKVPKRSYVCECVLMCLLFQLKSPQSPQGWTWPKTTTSSTLLHKPPRHCPTMRRLEKRGLHCSPCLRPSSAAASRHGRSDDQPPKEVKITAAHLAVDRSLAADAATVQHRYDQSILVRRCDASPSRRDTRSL